MISKFQLKQLIKELRPILSKSSTTKYFLNFKQFDALMLKNKINPNIKNLEDLDVICYLTGHKFPVETSLSTEDWGKALCATRHASRNSIVRGKMSECYQLVEKRLPPLLNRMEHRGIKADEKKLEELREKFAQGILELEKQIFAISEEEFNVNSPKQVRHILFEKLKLKPGKKSDSGAQLSTSADVLESLGESSEIARLILDCRHLYKLQNTYVEALLSRLKTDTRIHTTFLSTFTTTGRLASRNPNLQNIPAKTEYGKLIRNCFIPEDSFSLVSFDYSQIEIRVLAHVANVEPLIQIIREGKDVHSETAAKVFSVPTDKVTPEMRQKAKTINFGIIYGLGAVTLAKSVKISTQEARQYIEEYLKCYEGIKEYMAASVEEAEQNGFVSTILGHRCFIEDIHAASRRVKGHANRSSINAKIQGSASDIIKQAMVEIDDMLQDPLAHPELNTENCRPLLQIHDELVFEIHQSVLDVAKDVIKNIMENSIRVAVPLLVNCQEHFTK